MVKWEEMALVGRVARPHGLRGQVIVNLETDFPEERFRPGAELFVNQSGAVKPLRVAAMRVQQGRPVIALEGIDDIEVAAPLAGAELRVPKEWLTPLPEGTFYHHDLVGCEVRTVDGIRVGVVKDVAATGGGHHLVIGGERGEVLIPLAQEICRAIDPAAKRIVIAPPEGLLELNER